MVEATVAVTQPVVLVASAVDVDRHAVDTRTGKGVHHLLVEGVAIGHQSPLEAAALNLTAALHNVASHERLAAHGVDEHRCRVDMSGNLVEHLEEIAQRHLGGSKVFGTVAAAMPAGKVAAQRAFPEELPQGMLTAQALILQPCRLKCYFLRAIHCGHKDKQKISKHHQRESRFFFT